MARGNKRQHHGNRGKNQQRRAQPAATEAVNLAPREKKPPTRYGEAFVILEDEALNTFHYQSGAWIAHPTTIAEYRETSQVNALPQKVNSMTRYEVRCPV